jgi:hypothetical protein
MLFPIHSISYPIEIFIDIVHKSEIIYRGALSAPRIVCPEIFVVIQIEGIILI